MKKLQPFLSRISVASLLALLLLAVGPSQAQVYRIPGAREPEQKAAPAPKPGKKNLVRRTKKSVKKVIASKSSSKSISGEEMAIKFKVGQSTIDPNFGGNAASLKKIIRAVNDQLSDPSVDYVKVYFCGMASPEGSYQTNKTLAEQRLAALEKYVRGKVHIPENLVDRNSEYIPWERLAATVRKSNIQRKQQVLSIISTPEHIIDFEGGRRDRRVVRLMELDGGSVWKQLHSRCFGDMRNAAVVFDVVKSDKRQFTVNGKEVKADPDLTPTKIKTYQDNAMNHYNGKRYESAYGDFTRAGGRGNLSYDSQQPYDQCVEYMRFKRLKDSETVDDYENFMRRYPGSGYYAEISDIASSSGYNTDFVTELEWSLLANALEDRNSSEVERIARCLYGGMSGHSAENLVDLSLAYYWLANTSLLDAATVNGYKQKVIDCYNAAIEKNSTEAKTQYAEANIDMASVVSQYRQQVPASEPKPASEPVPPVDTIFTDYNGHAYVDLGLSVMWATCNVGASKPEEYGDYFAWGETSAKKEYLASNSKTDGKAYGNILADSRLDAAQANWGGTWRVPSSAELRELHEKCDWTWTKVNGINGYKVTSKVNGNSIFLPAAGYRYSNSLNKDGAKCLYCSSTPKEDHTSIACILSMGDGSEGIAFTYRERGLPIRPVNGDSSDVTPMKGTENGYGWVDLGLPSGLKWATCNAGANTPEEYGKYVPYAEAPTAAQVGGKWRLPSANEFDELRKNCQWTWKSVNGVNGYEVKSKVNSNSIFLPAGGYRDGTSLYHDGVDGYCWSSTKGEGLRFYDGYSRCVDRNDTYLQNVRPVFNDTATEHETKRQGWFQVTDGVTNGYSYVDLGLSVMWATCNVGATAPEGFGYYFAWGETKTKSNYTADNSATINKDFSGIGGDSRYDAARANWGGSWRLPTYDELEELKEKCDWTWTTVNGVKGYIVKNKVSGNCIFFPSKRYAGIYWSSTPETRLNSCAWALYFDSNKIDIDDIIRCNGCCVRPVRSLTSKELGLPATGTINGHEYVDLGLSVKWATCNVGTDSPLSLGNYFAWGEIDPRKRYDIDNYPYHAKQFEDIGGNPTYDAARASWGGSWRLPTRKEMDELRKKCEWTRTFVEGSWGYIVKSKVNGNRIFIKYGDHYSACYYWTSSPKDYSAHALYIDGDEFDMSWNNRFNSLLIRPVSD